MIYVTGDTHGSIDKLNQSNSILNKEDILIITGDFGFVWNNSDKEKLLLYHLNNLKYTIAFVDGNHENFDLLKKYPIKNWNGGKIHKVMENVLHLIRGNIFNINDLRIFVMGGAESIDQYLRIEGKDWWKSELPSWKEYNLALRNLYIKNWSVDYVISHTASKRISNLLGFNDNNLLSSFFEILENNLKFNHWFFGHFHRDIEIDTKHTLVYNKLIKI